ncbi:hypothetical protein ATN00_07195 [Sphingobium baderi]|uniref:Uncharacterized protein n=1 Tax=Sphingobium baderi TaxID=1332080 RepID=A0A0S3EXG5_9SPHN|nr:hypothetical protein ATN00_07195 [Sphingobium baderi]
MQEQHPRLRQCFPQLSERGYQRKLVACDSTEFGPLTLFINLDEHPVLSKAYADGYPAWLIVGTAHSDDSRYIGPFLEPARASIADFHACT